MCGLCYFLLWHQVVPGLILLVCSLFVASWARVFDSSVLLVAGAFATLAHGREWGACARVQAQACPTGCRGNVPY